MGDRKKGLKAPPSSRSGLVAGQGADIGLADSTIATNATTRVELNAEAQMAMTEYSNNAFAVPAREATKRRYTESVVLLAGVAAMAHDARIAWPVAVMVGAVVGATEGMSMLRSFLNKRRKP